nr:M23 family metallopeptidase [Leptolyngbya sp. FACHB-16]
MNKRAVRFGRILLAIGASLSVVAVLEAHQDMVGARSLNETSQATGASPSTLPPGLPPSGAIQSPQGTQATPQQVAQAQPSAGGQGTAVSTGNPNEQGQGLSNLSANQIAAVTRDNQWSGASFPLEQFQAYTSPFGYRRSIEGYNYNEFHYGLDMAAPRGSYIRNWWTGTVVEVSDDSNCGTSVVVEAGNWLSIFCHMEGRVEVSNGQRAMVDRDGGLRIVEGSTVQAGQRVGRVGMSGRTTGPHLHWGLKYDNNWVDPAMVLRAMYSSQQNTASRPN